MADDEKLHPTVAAILKEYGPKEINPAIHSVLFYAFQKIDIKKENHIYYSGTEELGPCDGPWFLQAMLEVASRYFEVECILDPTEGCHCYIYDDIQAIAESEHYTELFPAVLEAVALIKPEYWKTARELDATLADATDELNGEKDQKTS